MTASRYKPRSKWWLERDGLRRIVRIEGLVDQGDRHHHPLYRATVMRDLLTATDEIVHVSPGELQQIGTPGPRGLRVM
jgi:hypothetical protein